MLKNKIYSLMILLTFSFACNAKEKTATKENPKPNLTTKDSSSEQKSSRLDQIEKLTKQSAFPESGVVAHIGKDTVLAEEVNAEFNWFTSTTGQNIPQQHRRSLKIQILKRIARLKALRMEASKRKISVSDEEVAKQIEAMNGDPSASQWLKSQRSDERTIQQVKDSLMLKKLFLIEFKVSSEISEKEVSDTYAKNLERFTTPESFEASHILLRFPDGQVSKKLKKQLFNKINKIKTRLTPENFSEMAKEFSGCPSKANGGHLGVFQRGQMVKVFEDEAAKLKHGEISGIVETEFGYHLILLHKKTASSVTPLDKARVTVKDLILQSRLQSKDISGFILKIESQHNIRFLVN